MDKDNKYYNLIESMVRNHRKFDGLEPIVEDIIDRVYEQAKDSLDIIEEENTLKGYLSRIVSTEIIRVPKELNFKPQKQPEAEVNNNTVNVVETIEDSNETGEFSLESSDEIEETEDLSENYNEPLEPLETYSAPTEINTLNTSDIEVNQDFVEKMINGNLHEEPYEAYLPENNQDTISEEYSENNEYDENNSNSLSDDSNLHYLTLDTDNADESSDIYAETSAAEFTENNDVELIQTEQTPLADNPDDSQITLEEAFGNEGIFETEQNDSEIKLVTELNSDDAEKNINFEDQSLLPEESPSEAIQNYDSIEFSDSTETDLSEYNERENIDIISDSKTVPDNDNNEEIDETNSSPMINIDFGSTDNYSSEQNTPLSALESITTEELENLEYDNEIVEVPKDLSYEQNEQEQSEFSLDIEIPEDVVDMSPSDADEDTEPPDENNNYISNVLDDDYNNYEEIPNPKAVEESQNNIIEKDFQTVNSRYLSNIDADAIINDLTKLSQMKPDLNILNICELKYKKGYTIKQISDTLNLPPDVVVTALSEIISVI